MKLFPTFPMLVVLSNADEILGEIQVLLIGIKKVIVVEGIFKWRIASRQTKCHLSEFRLNPGFERSRSTITNEDYLGS